jgi:nucleotide-binding universal stress UspA family protein
MTVAGGCASMQAGPAIDTLKGRDKVVVLSLFADRIEWVHYGLTVFENTDAELVSSSRELDRRIAQAVARRLQARGVRAEAARTDQEMTGVSYGGSNPMTSGPESGKSLPLDRIRELAVREGADLVVVMTRPCIPGRCRGMGNANGITLESRSALGMHSGWASVFVKPFVFVIDARSGEEIFARHDRVGGAGRFDAQYKAGEFREALKRHEARVADLVVAYFEKEGAIWLDR